MSGPDRLGWLKELQRVLLVVGQSRSQNCEKRSSASSYPAVRPSVSPHRATRLPPNGFPRNFSFYFENLSGKLKYLYNRTRITGTLHADRYTLLIISRSVLLRMRNVSDRSCRENQNTHFVFSNFFPKIVSFMR